MEFEGSTVGWITIKLKLFMLKLRVCGDCVRVFARNNFLRVAERPVFSNKGSVVKDMHIMVPN